MSNACCNCEHFRPTMSMRFDESNRELQPMLDEARALYDRAMALFRQYIRCTVVMYGSFDRLSVAMGKVKSSVWLSLTRGTDDNVRQLALAIAQMKLPKNRPTPSRRQNPDDAFMNSIPTPMPETLAEAMAKRDGVGVAKGKKHIEQLKRDAEILGADSVFKIDTNDT